MPSGHRPPIPPGIARVALLGTHFGHKWTNVFYLQLSGSSIAASDLNTLASDLVTQWTTHIAPDLSSSTVLTAVEIVYIPSVGNEIQGSATASAAGSAGTAAVEDAGACAVVNWNINAYYRGGHPRWYHPGPLSAWVSNGSDIAPSNAASLAGAYGAMRNGINALTTTNITTVNLGTVSFQTGNAWRGTPVFRTFVSASVRLKLGTQRRRILS